MADDSKLPLPSTTRSTVPIASVASLTMEDTFEELRQSVTCNICFRMMYEPFTTHCGHSFCYSCLVQWFDRDKEARRFTCPECRAVVRERPAPSYALRKVAQLICGRQELLPEGETVEEHKIAQAEETLQIDGDRDNVEKGGLFRGCFRGRTFADIFAQRSLGPIHDAEDGVDRCPRCTWELQDGFCEQCGNGWDEFTDTDSLSSLAFRQHFGFGFGETGSLPSDDDDVDDDDSLDSDADSDLSGFVVEDDEHTGRIEGAPPPLDIEGAPPPPMNGGGSNFNGLLTITRPDGSRFTNLQLRDQSNDPTPNWYTSSDDSDGNSIDSNSSNGDTHLRDFLADIDPHNRSGYSDSSSNSDEGSSNQSPPNGLQPDYQGDADTRFSSDLENESGSDADDNDDLDLDLDYPYMAQNPSGGVHRREMSSGNASGNTFSRDNFTEDEDDDDVPDNSYSPQRGTWTEDEDEEEEEEEEDVPTSEPRSGVYAQVRHDENGSPYIHHVNPFLGNTFGEDEDENGEKNSPVRDPSVSLTIPLEEASRPPKRRRVLSDSEEDEEDQSPRAQRRRTNNQVPDSETSPETPNRSTHAQQFRRRMISRQNGRQQHTLRESRPPMHSGPRRTIRRSIAQVSNARARSPLTTRMAGARQPPNVRTVPPLGDALYPEVSRSVASYNNFVSGWSRSTEPHEGRGTFD